ncbi:ATP-binding cassette domain-containing protein [Candidatus Heimdallarchaeota archaeon]|nr:MAG: ATP-binding cassette domain-containing protein [Candidatus Heimdallarchaeota archaeon]
MIVNTVEDVLKVNNLTKVYGKEFSIWNKTFGRKVIGAKNVTFSVQHGEIFGFLGPNGAGKTTTIRSILDYLRIEKGKISIFGMDRHKKSSGDKKADRIYPR